MSPAVALSGRISPPRCHSRLARILGDPELEVNSLHHQGIRDVGAGLRVTARAPDGLVEGLERDGDGWVVAVQWHPEWLLEDDPRMKRLFEAFVQAGTNKQTT
jgi:putative glutamine amidotransferase